MSTVLITNTFDPEAGFQNETVVSSFVIHGQGPIEETFLLSAFDAVADFYTEAASPSTIPVGAFLASTLSRAAGGVVQKCYDITGHANGSNYGSPIATSAFALPAPYATNNLPPQVASVLTLRARGAVTAPVEGPGNTRPRSRLSGRSFIGGLNRAAIEDPALEVAKPAPVFRASCLNAAEALQDQLNAAALTWCVWSRANGLFRAVTSVEMDDSFDVLRSRKQRPGVRQKRVFSPEPSLALGA